MEWQEAKNSCRMPCKYEKCSVLAISSDFQTTCHIFPRFYKFSNLRCVARFSGLINPAAQCRGVRTLDDRSACDIEDAPSRPPLEQGRFYVGAESTCPQIYLLPPPQIQKLADRSDVISEIPKCSKIQIFRGSARTPLQEPAPDLTAGAYSDPQIP